jgi:Tol biopolymer transport system component
MRALPFLAAVLLVTTASARASSGSPPLWLFTSYPEGIPGQLFTSNGDSSRTLVFSGSPWHPSWSPDGTKIAFVSSSTLVVGNADGSALRDVATGLATNALYAWSPDGSQLAYGTSAGVSVAPATGGAAQHVTSDYPTFLEWSPDGTTLLLGNYRDDSAFYTMELVSLRTGSTRVLGLGADGFDADGYMPARFSPDGTRVAYIHNLTLRLIDVDGTNDHRVTRVPAADVAWSPTGQLVFASSRTSDGVPSYIYSTTPLEVNLWTVSPDAGAIARRLTGPFDDSRFHESFAGSPSFSSDGSRMSFHSSAGVMQSNADGTCAEPVHGVYEGPLWNPSVTVARLDCVDLQAWVTQPTPRITRGRQSSIELRIENHGTEPATDVSLVVEPVGKRAKVGLCTRRCTFRSIAPGTMRRVAIPYRGLRAGIGGIHYEVRAAQTDLTPNDLSGSFHVVIH